MTTAAAPQGAGMTIYHYDLQGRLIAETTPQGNPIFTYVWRDDVPVSIIVHGATETVLYLEVDHLNTPIAARNQAGQVVWKWESDAFGMTLPNEDPGNTGKKTTINLRFPGQYYDKESGLHYNWRRYYDPKLGRYLSPDPIGLAGGANLMAYVNGNPLSFIDPLGLYKYNAPAPRTVPVEGETENSLGCLEQCLRATTQNSKLELLVTGGAETKGHSKNSRHYTGEACDIAPTKAGNDQVNDCASRCGFRGGQFESFPDNPNRNHYHFQQEPGNGVPRLTPFTPDP